MAEKVHGMKNLVEALEFLAALKAQLEDTADLGAMRMDKYGLLVPVVVSKRSEVAAQEEADARVGAEVRAREWAWARTVAEAMEVIRCLIQRFEQSQKISFDDLR